MGGGEEREGGVGEDEGGECRDRRGEGGVEERKSVEVVLGAIVGGY